MPHTLATTLPALAPVEDNDEWFIEWTDTPLALWLHTHPQADVDGAIRQLISPNQLSHWYVDCVDVDPNGWDVWLLERE
jgi:hypothetical protein